MTVGSLSLMRARAERWPPELAVLSKNNLSVLTVVIILKSLNYRLAFRI